MRRASTEVHVVVEFAAELTLEVVSVQIRDPSRNAIPRSCGNAVIPNGGNDVIPSDGVSGDHILFLELLNECQQSDSGDIRIVLNVAELALLLLNLLLHCDENVGHVADAGTVLLELLVLLCERGVRLDECDVRIHEAVVLLLECAESDTECVIHVVGHRCVGSRFFSRRMISLGEVIPFHYCGTLQFLWNTVIEAADLPDPD